MVTDETLLDYIEEVLPKLTEKHHKIVDICIRLRALIKEKQKIDSRYRAPKRDRAAYMRRYRARKASFSTHQPPYPEPDGTR